MTWEQVGTFQGLPEALAVNSTTIAVLAGGKVLVSADGGRSFQARVRGVQQG